MKTRVSNEQKRCRVAGGEKSFVIHFFVYFVSRQKKNTQLLNHLICRFISKTSLSSDSAVKLL